MNGDGCTAELLAQRAGQTLCQQILQVMLVEKETTQGVIDDILYNMYKHIYIYLFIFYIDTFNYFTIICTIDYIYIHAKFIMSDGNG